MCVSDTLLAIAHDRVRSVAEGASSHGTHAVAGLRDGRSHSRGVLSVTSREANRHAQGVITIDTAHRELAGLAMSTHAEAVLRHDRASAKACRDAHSLDSTHEVAWRVRTMHHDVDLLASVLLVLRRVDGHG